MQHSFSLYVFWTAPRRAHRSKRAPNERNAKFRPTECCGIARDMKLHFPRFHSMMNNDLFYLRPHFDLVNCLLLHTLIQLERKKAQRGTRQEFFGRPCLDECAYCMDKITIEPSVYKNANLQSNARSFDGFHVKAKRTSMISDAMDPVSARESPNVANSFLSFWLVCARARSFFVFCVSARAETSKSKRK